MFEKYHYLWPQMSKIFSLALSILLLVQSLHMEMVNIVQLQDLITHVQFHKEKYGDNFFDFISKHYGAQKEQHHLEHQEEHKDHERLPLNQQPCLHSATVFVLNDSSLLSLKELPLMYTDSVFFYKESIIQLAGTDIFQPPKYA